MDPFRLGNFADGPKGWDQMAIYHRDLPPIGPPRISTIADGRWAYPALARGTPGAVVRTDWTTGQIWLRGEFGLSRKSSPGREQLRLRIHHDEDVVVYLNGVEAFREAGFLTSYDDVELNPQAVWALRPGRNLIAVTCQQTEGGQYVDVGLVLPDDSCRRLSP